MSLKMKLLATAAIAVVLSPAIARAEVNNGYVSAAGAWNILDDQDLKGAGSSTSANFQDGWGAIGALGLRFNENYRSEVEIGIRENKVESISGTSIEDSGRNRTWTFMLNGLYDFNNSSPLTPYLGVGVGLANIEYIRVATSTTSIVGSDVQPAAQGIVGLNYKITDHVSVFTNYQYLITSKFEISTNGAEANDEYKSNTILAGLTFKFGGPKSRPMAYQSSYSPMAEELSQNKYTLFFEWDKADLTNEGKRVVSKAAEKAKTMSPVLIDVTGHADTSGTEEHNMKLSKKRAETVKKALVKLGIAEKDITVYAKGESDLLVPTADNVREAKNRRVVIVYTGK